MKILLVEDSERLRRALGTGLKNAGFAVDAVGDGEQGLAFARHGDHDVVVLDLMLPGMDGLTVLRRLREAGSKVHVLVLEGPDEGQNLRVTLSVLDETARWTASKPAWAGPPLQVSARCA